MYDEEYVQKLEKSFIGLIKELDTAKVRWVGEMLKNINVDYEFIKEVERSLEENDIEGFLNETEKNLEKFEDYITENNLINSGKSYFELYKIFLDDINRNKIAVKRAYDPLYTITNC